MHNGTPSKRWKGTDVKRIRKSIAEIKEEIYDTLGGIAGAVKYYKRHPSAFYPDYFKTPPQPLIQNNVNVGINAEADGEVARRKLETAFMRLIEARKCHDSDPAVYVDGERLIEHQPASPDPAPSTADNGELNESSSSPQKGPLNGRGGVATTPGGSTAAGGQKTNSMYSSSFSSVPGLAAGVALDGLDDHLSTTERFLLWKGHGGPP
jgi:hypothetical protein